VMKAPILREQRQMASVAGKVPSEFNGLQTNFLRNEQELFSPNREFSRQMTIQIAILFRSEFGSETTKISAADKVLMLCSSTLRSVELVVVCF